MSDRDYSGDITENVPLFMEKCEQLTHELGSTLSGHPNIVAYQALHFMTRRAMQSMIEDLGKGPCDNPVIPALLLQANRLSETFSELMTLVLAMGFGPDVFDKIKQRLEEKKQADLAPPTEEELNQLLDQLFQGDGPDKQVSGE